jgi:hypothetical protein
MVEVVIIARTCVIGVECHRQKIEEVMEKLFMVARVQARVTCYCDVV